MFARSKIVTLGVFLLAVMMLIAACAPAAAPAASAQAPAAVSNAPANSNAAPVAVSNASSSSSAAPAAAGPIVLEVVNNDQLGKFLADGKGMTLYMFTKDTKDTSNCYGKCETAWPPLLQSDKPTVKDGVDAKLLGTTTRKDGSIQVTYAGMPLYYYFEDKASGDVLGQNSNKVWFVVAPDGSVVKK
jgi:predicted lipoprotein with Yx(FWY)xxD motif